MPIIWNWLAKHAAPIIAAFLAGQYIAGRNCEESQLRIDNAALAAEIAGQKALITERGLRLAEQAEQKRAADTLLATERTKLYGAVSKLPAAINRCPVTDADLDNGVRDYIAAVNRFAVGDLSSGLSGTRSGVERP